MMEVEQSSFSGTVGLRDLVTTDVASKESMILGCLTVHQQVGISGYNHIVHNFRTCMIDDEWSSIQSRPLPGHRYNLVRP